MKIPIPIKIKLAIFHTIKYNGKKYKRPFYINLLTALFWTFVIFGGFFAISVGLFKLFGYSDIYMTIFTLLALHVTITLLSPIVEVKE